MSERRIETDYLVVGAGAAALAFVDSLIAETDAEVVMVDRRDRPGGHWNDAYPFVRLHQPSANYGVNSRALGDDAIDETGPNAGFYERASGPEICDYFHKVMDEHLLPSGQVRFFGGCDYVGSFSGEHAFTSRPDGEATQVHVRRKVVDTTYLQVTIPATHTPAFTVDPDARFIPVGGLVDVTDAPDGYTILGAGKTGMDACNWLLDNGVDPDAIRWVKPREPWLMDRARLQPLDLLVPTIEGFSLGIEALAQAESLPDLFARLEAAGGVTRVDRSVEPTMYRGAITSEAERESCRQIERVVRHGRVEHIGTDRIVLAEGEVPTSPGEIHVDCTASGFHSGPTRPIFEPGRITLQSLMGAYFTFNAAMLGFVEAKWDDDAEKNRLCPPVSQPTRPADWIKVITGALDSLTTQSSEPELTAWSERSRLNLTRGLNAHIGNPRMQAAMARWFGNMAQATTNAERLLASAGTPDRRAAEVAAS